MVGAAGGAVLAAVGHVHAKGVVVGAGVGVGVGRPASMCHKCECTHHISDMHHALTCKLLPCCSALLLAENLLGAWHN